MRLLVTGVSGFLGNALTRKLLAHGHNVRGTSRSGKRERHACPPIPTDVELHPLTLGEMAPTELLSNIDVVIHCAYDFSGSCDKNVSATKALVTLADSCGVRRHVFISSYSASKNAETSYGRAKFILESFFEDRNALILRPGLVLGPGGLAKKVLNAARKWPIFPAVGGKSAKFPFVSLNDFVEVTVGMLEAGTLGVVNLFYAQYSSLAEWAELVREVTGRHSVIAPIPLGPLAFALGIGQSLLEPLSLRLPEVVGSVVSLHQNQVIKSNVRWPRLPPEATLSLRDMIRETLQVLGDKRTEGGK